MDDENAGEGFSRAPTLEDLVHLCKELNDAEAKYVMIGGFAVAHHGFLRATKDIGLLIEGSAENVERVRQALSYLPDKAALQVGQTDIQEYSVVRVADEFVIDLLGAACGITYEDVKSDVDSAVVDNVKTPYADLRSLIQTKQSIRPQDTLDRAFLEGKLQTGNP